MQFGLIGANISYSFSPQIHQIIFRLLGVDATYRLIQIPKTEIVKAKGIVQQMDGINVTIPYKQTLLRLCDEISTEAGVIGAVNTIHFENGKLYGYNTDYYGFGCMMRTVGYTSDNPPDTCVVLGCGGASLAVIKYLKDIGTKRILAVSRTGAKPFPIPVITYEDLKNLQGDILINATPVGTSPKVNECPVCEEIIKKFHTALDLIYNPDPTMFLKKAQKFGLKTCSGLIMLVGQAVKSEEIWLRQTISESVLKAVYMEMKSLV